MTQSKDIGNYIVYTDGRIWSKFKKNWLKPKKDKNGYLSVNISGKTMKVHRVIAQAFLSNPLNHPEVDHINANKQDNNLHNLQWCTTSFNNKKAYEQGRIRMRGILNGQSQLTEEDVMRIKYEHRDLSQPQIASLYGLTQPIISRIRNGKRWAHI
jgi:hypothetical protein